MVRAPALSLMALCGALAPSAAAQTVTVPAAQPAIVTGTHHSLPGFTGRARHQVIVGAGELGLPVGSKIDAVRLRRAELLNVPFSSTTVQVKLTLSQSARPPARPSAVFAQNRGGQPIVVYDGPLSLPASPGPASPRVWSTPDAVELTFLQPFLYQGGDLCLDFEGDPLGGARWPVDAVHPDLGSSVRLFGTPCGVGATRSDWTAAMHARFVMPGGDCFVITFGQPSSNGFLVLGAAPTTVTLDAFGAPGCSLLVRPDALLPLAFPPSLVLPDARASVRLSLPSSPNLLNVSFFVQGINLETPAVSNPAGLTTTNAIEARIGSVMPQAGISSVISERVGPGEAFPASGRVVVSGGPVIQFVLQ